MHQFRIFAGLALASGLSACGPGPTSSVAEEPLPIEVTQKMDKIEEMRPPDQAAYLQAFDDRNDLIAAAPNVIAKENVERAANAELCRTIKSLRTFRNWTAEVRAISKPADDPQVAEITMTQNGSIAGYLMTARVPESSPLYAALSTLKDDLLRGSDVRISGIVLSGPVDSDRSSDMTTLDERNKECARDKLIKIRLDALQAL